MDQFVSDCANHQNANYRQFGVYFNEYYAPRYNMWALSCRSLLAYTTNMSLEAFHKQFKHHGGLLDGNLNQRLDTLLHNLDQVMSLVWQRTEHCEASGGFLDKASTECNKIHNEAAKQSLDRVTPLLDGWSVQSFENPGASYKVTTTLYMCPYIPCFKKCQKCGVCWHRFKCSCAFASNNHHRSNSCKHAHLVKMSLNVPPSYVWRPWECNNASIPTTSTGPVSLPTSSLPSQVPRSGISHIVLPGRRNTPAKKQRQSSKLYRTSKPKGKKPKTKESQTISYEDRIQMEEELSRNIPQPCNLADLGIFEAMDLSELGL